MIKSCAIIVSLLASTISFHAVGSEATPPASDRKEAKEIMEEHLVESWHFFRDGDSNRDGSLSETEFMAHPVYAKAQWKTDAKTFVFWMVDDDKDGSISLQEWINNEVGQFQLGDRDHDGVIDTQEYAAITAMQRKLFGDVGLD